MKSHLVPELRISSRKRFVLAKSWLKMKPKAKAKPSHPLTAILMTPICIGVCIYVCAGVWVCGCVPRVCLATKSARVKVWVLVYELNVKVTYFKSLAKNNSEEGACWVEGLGLWRKM